MVTTSVATVTSTSVLSTTASDSELTCSSSSTPGIMLITSQQAPATTSVVMNPGSIMHPIDNSSQQFGRKIMPKPTIFNPQTLMAPFSLAPIPLPTCSINIAPSIAHDVDGCKKKRTRKKKVKDVDNLPLPKDILATATASLFSPEKASNPLAVPVAEPVAELSR